MREKIEMEWQHKGEVQGVRGLAKDIKEIKAYLQDNMKAGMCRNGERLKRNDIPESYDIKSTINQISFEGGGR